MTAPTRPARPIAADPVPPAAPSPYGPNDLEPCGTESARRRHLAHGRDCAVCGVGDE
ncbi:hypothetical protein O7626_00325 [Micromonospora sp. WMMD1102]|uniref:hypothetical protein n=1 Tax=Micromonospora sp. WMMD1102 TaxID=3016105 RepID=UPI002414DB01|nr:hypothetical protein [Micromonospora sp. WMMD1102]MDG4784391.1 hypothetical protein [Micromonospora sp. WMMD1102]